MINEILMSFEMGFIYGIIAIGIYITFRIINFPDLTCDGSFVFGAATSGVLIKLGYNSWFCLFGGLISGCLAGFFTGVLYFKFKITDLLSGILTSFMLYSINLHIMGGIPNITFLGSATIFAESSGLTSIILLFSISFVICALISYVFLTDFGLALRSIGQNQKLAKAYGIDIKKMTIIGLMMSNGLIGLGGALFSQNQSFADLGSGTGTIIIGLASVIIGEKIFKSKNMVFKIFSCLLGSIIYRIIINLALHSDSIGLKTSDLNLITGLIVILIMYFSPKKKYANS